MKRTVLVSLLAMLALPIACGGGAQDGTQPVAPVPSATPSAVTPVDTGSAAASAAPPASAAPSASAVASTSAAPTPAGPPGPGDWDKWTHDQKLAYMKSAVMPKEKELFSAHNAKKFGDMNCKTCHGSAAADGSFKMPNPDLPKLDPKMFQAKNIKRTAIWDFMVQTVVPQTAALLGEQPYDPKTNTGFGCFECHTKK